MTSKTRTMALASFAADILALVAHWICDPRQIAAALGRVNDFRAPGQTALPERWRRELNARAQIEALLDGMDQALPPADRP